MESRQVVEQFWAAMQTNDFQFAGELLHDDDHLDWPQSGERIRGRANFVAGRVITFSTIQDGMILQQTEFWPDPFEPAAWRTQWVEKIYIVRSLLWDSLALERNRIRTRQSLLRMKSGSASLR